MRPKSKTSNVSWDPSGCIQNMKKHNSTNNTVHVNIPSTKSKIKLLEISCVIVIGKLKWSSRVRSFNMFKVVSGA